MRLLLIDNHDSFTAILSHYLWELAGERPTLFRNDELTRDALDALEFDAVVLSPGPGHPANVRDFGICRDLLELFPHKPVLGVCLGMQGMAHFAGARVIPFPDARHGRPSRILHDGTGIFRDLPSEFPAVRYHSLVVDETSLPANISVTARSSEDHQVMGIFFADHPWFGVQFHPESVGTEHGKKLLENFLDIAKPDRIRPTRARPESVVAGEQREGARHHPEAPHLPAIPYLELAWRSPAEVFSCFIANAGNSFWLDGMGWGASAMGLAESGVEFGDWASCAAWIEARKPSDESTAPWEGYRGGPVGQFSYELYHETLGVAMQHPPNAPVARWLLPEGFVVFDTAVRKVYAAWEGDRPPAWLQAMIDGWESNVAAPVSELVEVSDATLPPFTKWKSLLSQEEHAVRVSTLQDAIARGETYEACLTHAYSVVADADPAGVYRRLRVRNPAPYAAYLSFSDVKILSVSPELFLEGRADGMLRSRPIKGTRRRGGDPESDRVLRDELAASEKDGAENRMIVDLTRHDLARSCRPGSVVVPEFLTVEEHPAVFQLVSEVRGRLASGVSATDAVAACFPGGSMTGAPKERTVEILAALEKELRGVYSGAIGYFTRDGAFMLSMAIRMLENRGTRWRVGCGGAVLADSDAAAEWREAVVKARSVIDAAGFTAS